MISNRLPPGRQGFVFTQNVEPTGDGGFITRPEVRPSQRSGIPIPEPPDMDAMPVCILRADEPVPTHRDWYRPGYEPFSYFFPPNHPRTDVPLMPLIIAPTSFKTYEEFAHVFDPLWDSAASALAESDRIVVIGYSFPATDSRSLDLIRTRIRSGAPLTVEIVNPAPDPVVDTLVNLVGLDPTDVAALPMTFDEYVD